MFCSTSRIASLGSASLGSARLRPSCLLAWEQLIRVNRQRQLGRSLALPIVRRAFLLTGTLGILLLLGACRKTDQSSGSTDRTQNAPEQTTTFFFTCQTHGRLTHCGCFRGQFGGLARLSSALKQIGLSDAIGVDVGDAIEGPEDFHQLKYQRVVKAYAGMGYAVMNVGHREAMLSADRLREIASKSEVPLISANLLDRKTGKPVLDGWKIIQHGRLKIAFVGVLDSQGLTNAGGDSLGEGLEIEPIESCLSRILPEVKRSADLMVLLAFTDEATLSSLASQFYEFGVILGGRVSQPAQDLVQTNRSLILYTGNEGKSFGYIQVKTAPHHSPEAGQNQIQLLHDHFPEDPTVLSLLTDYRKEVEQTQLGIDDPSHASANAVPGTRISAQFVGSEACLGCHQGAAKVWHNSLHSIAFDSLVRTHAQADPTCIGCHTIGFEMPTGYRRQFGATKLTQVGCESCHGPGSLHVAQRTSGGKVTFHFRPLAGGDCLKCHQGEFSPPFNWDNLWPQIKHGL